VVAGSVLVLVTSGIWSWRARHLLVDREAKVHSGRRGRFSVNSSAWSWGAIIAGAALIAGSVLILIQGLMPTPNYASPYDGLDPQQSPCLESAERAPAGSADLYDGLGGLVGIVTLMQSVNCSTVWGRVVLMQQEASRLKGYTIKIVIERPGDGAEIPYAIRLGGATVAYGSMLSDSQSCVLAEAALRPKDSPNYGRYSVTACIAQT
jgi:hypothetical protein